MKMTHYDEKYAEHEQYWGREISKMALRILELYPARATRPRVLEIGCGEGTNAIFLARNGYDVTAFDLSPVAIEKTNQDAKQFDVNISTFVADINEFDSRENYDVIFSSGTLQYLHPEKRTAFIEKMKEHTTPGGLHVLHTFANHQHIPRAPDAESSEFPWNSGELLSLYQNWRIESFIEEIKSCNSSGVPHEHSHNRIWTRRLQSGN
jgi:tellurite methyltransferase